MTTNFNSSFTRIVIEIALLVALVLPYFLLSRITKIEHDDFHQQWENDGSPHGMPFWFALKERGSFGFGSYPWFVGYRWLFKTPDWVKGHQDASKYLKLYRIVSFVFYIGWSVLCIGLLVLASKQK